jgi:FtsH-binding integral membrane protein
MVIPVAMGLLGAFVAVGEVALFGFLGSIVDWLTDADRTGFLEREGARLWMMGGFLLVGLLVAIVASIANIFLGIPALSLTISAAVVLIMSGLILFHTSNIINGGETNYVLATINLYMALYNLFVNMLHLLAAFGGDE